MIISIFQKLYKRWHQGVITGLRRDAQGKVLYDGRHTKTADDGKWCGFKDFSAKVLKSLSNKRVLEIFPGYLKLQIVSIYSPTYFIGWKQT